MKIHHVQLSGPAGCEDRMRAFYAGALGMTEVPEPEALRAARRPTAHAAVTVRVAATQ